MGTGMTLPFLYIYLHEVRRIDATVVGLVVAWMGVLSLVLAGPSGALMDRFGARRVLLPLYGVGAVGAVSWSLDHAAWQAFVSGTILALAGHGLRRPERHPDLGHRRGRAAARVRAVVRGP